MAPPNASHDRSHLYGQTAHRTSSADPEANDAAWMFFGRIGRHAQAQKYGYGCDYCPKVHTRPQDLWRHLEHIHGHEVIACVYPGCKEVFPKARKDYMLRHLQASHGVQRE
ncbi:hypothetical protein IQ06DRAFT_294585 [Phaeosphaeriaceae sp. SRC1lsM3a]|nr:hypothetical protein IQ06DRAFT_294585 [Stagonospora sp. SRC1lsM3a]